MQQAEKQQQDVAKAEAALAKAQADLAGLPGLDQSASQDAGDVDNVKAELRDLAAQVPLLFFAKLSGLIPGGICEPPTEHDSHRLYWAVES